MPRGRPRKAQVEGAVSEPVSATVLAAKLARSHPDPAPGNNSEALSRLVEFFKAEHPDTWEDIRLCPLQHGVEAMIGALK